MSVIVTDMKMPSGCWCCEFSATWDNESSLCKRKPMESPVENYKERPSWCPLKEQTPHRKTFWDSLSEADLMEPMHHFED